MDSWREFGEILGHCQYPNHMTLTVNLTQPEKKHTSDTASFIGAETSKAFIGVSTIKNIGTSIIPRDTTA